jgi:hypothetical protein
MDDVMMAIGLCNEGRKEGRKEDNHAMVENMRWDVWISSKNGCPLSARPRVAECEPTADLPYLLRPPPSTPTRHTSRSDMKQYLPSIDSDV